MNTQNFVENYLLPTDETFLDYFDNREDNDHYVSTRALIWDLSYQIRVSENIIEVNQLYESLERVLSEIKYSRSIAISLQYDCGKSLRQAYSNYHKIRAETVFTEGGLNHG